MTVEVTIAGIVYTERPFSNGGHDWLRKLGTHKAANAEVNGLVDRVLALEAALRECWVYDSYRCSVCQGNTRALVSGREAYPVVYGGIGHTADCIVPTLPEVPGAD